MQLSVVYHTWAVVHVLTQIIDHTLYIAVSIPYYGSFHEMHITPSGSIPKYVILKLECYWLY